MDMFLSAAHSAIRLTIPYLLISLGGLFCFKTNVFNLALEGFSLFACLASVAGTYYTQSVFGGIMIAMLATGLYALIYAAVVLELNVDPIVCSLAFNLLSAGITRYLLMPLFNTSGRFVLGTSLGLNPIDVPILKDIPILGDIFNSQTLLAYLSFILVGVVYVFMYKTKTGFHMRIVGLNEKASASAGVSSKRIRYLAIILCGVFCGLAGSQIALSLNMFNFNMTDGKGWTAVIILMMTDSRPVWTLVASVLFGVADAIMVKLNGYGISAQILAMIPYLLAFIFTVLPLFSKKMRVKLIRNRAAKRSTMVLTDNQSENINF